MSESNPHSIEAQLAFFQDPIDKSDPYNYVEEPPKGEPRRNYGDDFRIVPISDIRGHEDQFSLDHDAFQILGAVESSTTYETFDDDEVIRRVYYPEVEQLILKHVPGARSVVLFDHTIRRSNPNAARQPVNQVHADQTARSAELRVRRHAANESQAEEYLRSRYRIINVWRPINGKVESSPLAFASAATTPESDFVKIEHRYPSFNGEIMGVKYNPSSEWTYCYGLDNHERVLLKCFDSEDGVAKRVAHTAFSYPPKTEGVTIKGRESIEVRALVFG